MPARQMERGIDGLESLRRDLAPRRDRLAGLPQCVAERPEFCGGKRPAAGRRELPLLEKKRQPGWVVEPVPARAVGVPFLAVDKVHPGSGFAVALGAKLAGAQWHGNGLTKLDSLPDMVYSGNEYRALSSLRARGRMPGERFVKNRGSSRASACGRPGARPFRFPRARQPYSRRTGVSGHLRHLGL